MPCKCYDFWCNRIILNPNPTTIFVIHDLISSATPRPQKNMSFYYSVLLAVTYLFGHNIFHYTSPGMAHKYFALSIDARNSGHRHHHHPKQRSQQQRKRQKSHWKYRMQLIQTLSKELEYLLATQIGFMTVRKSNMGCQ